MSRKIKFPAIKDTDIYKLEKFINEKPTSYQDARSKLVLSLFYYQGIKTSIAQRLTYENYNIKDNILIFPKDNFLTEYIQIIPEDKTRNLLQYLQKFKLNSAQRLIRNVDYSKKSAGLPITVRSLQRLLRELSKQLNLSMPLNPRSLRHLCAVRITAELLMHKSLDHLIGRVSPWVFTEYKRLSGNPRKQGIF